MNHDVTATRVRMRTLSTSIYLAADVGVATDVQAAGTSLENPYVYDSVARDLKAMEREGLLRVIDENYRREGGAIERIRFVRLR